MVLQHFATAEDMDAGAQAFSAMDAADTPGTRSSVDMTDTAGRRRQRVLLCANSKSEGGPGRCA